jgi:hypothetical protein
MSPDNLDSAEVNGALAEVTPMRGDDEKYTGSRERETCDDRSSLASPNFGTCAAAARRRQTG